MGQCQQIRPCLGTWSDRAPTSARSRKEFPPDLFAILAFRLVRDSIGVIRFEKKKLVHFGHHAKIQTNFLIIHQIGVNLSQNLTFTLKGHSEWLYFINQTVLIMGH